MKLDFGCGKNCAEGFEGVDILNFGQKHVFDLRQGTWPFEENSIEEARSSHFVEHLEVQERVHFFNELHRILQMGAKAQIIAPHWSNDRAYGDPTHKWPPISDWIVFYLNKEWRMANAPHTDISNLSWGYSCNFDYAWGYSMEPDTANKHQEAQQFRSRHYLNARQDLFFTIQKR